MSILTCTSDPGDKAFIKSLIKKINNQKIFNLDKLDLKKNFNKKLIDILIKREVTSVIVGLGYKNKNINKKIIKVCKRLKIKSFGICDSYQLFLNRVKFLKKTFLPDFYCVSDKIAFKLAVKDGVPKKKLVIIGNQFIHDNLLKYYKKKIKINKNTISFISDPLNNNLISKGFKDFYLSIYPNEIDYFSKIYLENFKKTKKFYFICHPKHDQVKIKKILNLPKVKVIYKSHHSKMKILLSSQTIVGMNSILLVLLKLMNINVYFILNDNYIEKNNINFLKKFKIKRTYGKIKIKIKKRKIFQKKIVKIIEEYKIKKIKKMISYAQIS